MESLLENVEELRKKYQKMKSIISNPSGHFYKLGSIVAPDKTKDMDDWWLCTAVE